MMLIDEKFSLGQVVFVITDMDQLPHMVVGITVRPGHITYVLSSGAETFSYTEIELSTIKSVLIGI